MPEETILDRIVARRRQDVEAARNSLPAAELAKRVAGAPEALDFPDRLRVSDPVAIIGEIKRASPSRGDIAPAADAVTLALAFAGAGAAGISVLTEPHWFRGELSDLEAVRRCCASLGEQRPGLLRKDFIVDEYQVLEARAAGADSVLLIVAALDQQDLEDLVRTSRGLGMEPLVEINNRRELDRALEAGATLVGINNRDLRTFNVDLDTTDRLASAVPDSVLLAALSGVRGRSDIERFAAAGARAALVGETLMLAPEPEAKMRELLGVGVPR
ncbi:MAG: indole-3-glycerol phosphate synthase TrpC [Dehalococcoidia bacterium]